MIYVVGFDEYVKIGFTRDFAARHNALQEGLPRKLETFVLIQGEVADERALHRRFAKYRLRGEWFAFAGELAKWIEQHCGGSLSERRVRRTERAQVLMSELGLYQNPASGLVYPNDFGTA